MLYLIPFCVHALCTVSQPQSFQKNYVRNSKPFVTQTLAVMADSKLSISLDDLSAVYEATYQARAKWKQMLLALQVNNTTIETINIRCREDPDNCYLEGLSEWLKGEERNWTDVFKALSRSSVGHSDLAKVVERRLTKATGNTESFFSLQLATNG